VVCPLFPAQPCPSGTTNNESFDPFLVMTPFLLDAMIMKKRMEGMVNDPFDKKKQNAGNGA